MNQLHIASSADVNEEQARAEYDDRDAERGTRRDESLLRRRVFLATRGKRPRRGLLGTWGRPRILPTGVIAAPHGRA